MDGQQFADLWLKGTDRGISTMEQLSAADADRLRVALTKAAEEVLSGGDPIGLDTIIVIARK